MPYSEATTLEICGVQIPPGLIWNPDERKLYRTMENGRKRGIILPPTVDHERVQVAIRWLMEA